MQSRDYKETIEMSKLQTQTPSTSSPVQDDPFRSSTVLKEGTLMKTSQSKSKNSSHGHPRPRKFKLTSQSLDYLQTFSHVRWMTQCSLPKKIVSASLLQPS